MYKRTAAFWPLIVLPILSLPSRASAQTVPPAAGERMAEASAPERRWPLVVESGDESITVYQPQLESFKGDKLTARAAVSIEKKGQPEPTFGAMWIESRVSTDRVARTVDILEINVIRARFPDADQPSEKTLTEALRRGLTGRSMTLSLDQLLAMLATVEKEQKTDEDLRTQPPKIEFRSHPAVLVQYDGAPRLTPVADSELMRAVNTPFLVLLDPATKTYYLKGAGQWFSASDALGPYQDAKQVPAAARAIAEKGGYTDPNEPTSAAGAEALEIVTATEPTELIWTDGSPEMSTITGTDLLYVVNTDGDVFVMIESQNMYVLLSGRWYTARHREGPWTYVAPDKLPDDFKHIPPGSEKGDVLAHVAGTEPAKDALLDSYVPQTAAIDRKKVEKPNVAYDGEPRFEPVEGTSITYAANTPYAVLKVEKSYYCCDNAVWYVSTAAIGPWEVCDTVPQVIYALPPSCPIYPVKYVYVYESTPEIVYCGYTPGYVGCYPYHGVVVFGTGYVYPGWFGAVYYPRPQTFGFCAHYNAYTGNWGFSVGVHGPNGWLGFHAGTYGWAAAGVGPHGAFVAGGWWGCGGYRSVDFNRNVNIHATGYGVHGNVVDPGQFPWHEHNVYDRRQDVRHDTGHEPVAARRDGQPGTPAGAREGGEFGRGGRPNDVFTDRDGNVYRKTLDGWETRDQGRWTPSDRSGTAQRPGAAERPAQQDRPAARPANQNWDQQRQNLDRESRARAAGQYRPQTYQRQTPPSRGGDFRGGGGGRGGRR